MNERFDLFYEEKNIIEKFLDNWLNEIRVCVKAQTFQKYKFLIDEHIKPELRILNREDINIKTLNDYVYNKSISRRKDGKGGLSASYVNTICYIINSSLREILPEKIKRPRIKKKQTIYLSLCEQKTLEKYILANDIEKGIGIILSLYTGMRIGEICALKWSDIDFTAQTVRISKSLIRIKEDNNKEKKTRVIIDSAKTESSDRVIPIPQNIMKILNKLPQDGYLLKGKNNSFCDTRSYQYYFKGILKKCGLKDINYHSLRHTLATRCIEAGVDIKTLSEILGHSNVNVTLNTYVHSTLSHKKLQMEKMLQYCK